MDFLNNEVLAKAYYAGLFDGEGSVGVYMIHDKTNNKHNVRLTTKVTNTYHPALVYLLEKFGGSIENNRASEKYAEWQDTYSWKVNSRKAVEFVDWIYPYSIIKRDQLDVVKDFWSYYEQYKQNKYQRPDQNKIDWFINRLKDLKRGR